MTFRGVALNRRAEAGNRPRICILALSAIADDPRVRRQGDAFARRGWDVVGVGLPGAGSAAPDWPVLFRQSANEAAQDAGRRAPRRRGRAVLHRALGVRYRLVYAARLQWVRLRPGIADRIYWSFSQNIRDLYELARTVEADVWLANDWNALPIAARLAAEKGGVYAYDSHEFAREEYFERWRWRFWQRPLVCAIEGRYIKEAAIVSAVSGGIGEQLARNYDLPAPPLVIRNTPAFEAATFRPTGERIRVLYHGIVVPGRGIEATIDSVKWWRPEFDLMIRGPGDEDFKEALRARIRTNGVADRVALVPPVPMTELVSQARPFDIGFFALPGHSRHNEFALPNKIFEYVMAGLALCVTDLPELARLVREHGLGVLMRRLEPEAIAAAINGLDREAINACKRNSLKAARELCWERESERMLAAYQALLPRAAAE